MTEKLDKIQKRLDILTRREKQIRTILRFKRRCKKPLTSELLELDSNLSEQIELLRELLDIKKKDLEGPILQHATGRRKEYGE